GIADGLPSRWTKINPLLPAVTLPLALPEVCPHGDGALDVLDLLDALGVRRRVREPVAAGRKLSACSGTTSAFFAVFTPIVAFAVIPGSSLPAALSMSVMTVYVTTLFTVAGFTRTCVTFPL